MQNLNKKNLNNIGKILNNHFFDDDKIFSIENSEILKLLDSGESITIKNKSDFPDLYDNSEYITFSLNNDNSELPGKDKYMYFESNKNGIKEGISPNYSLPEDGLINMFHVYKIYIALEEIRKEGLCSGYEIGQTIKIFLNSDDDELEDDDDSFEDEENYMEEDLDEFLQSFEDEDNCFEVTINDKEELVEILKEKLD